MTCFVAGRDSLIDVFSRKVWLVLAVIIALWGVWHAASDVTIFRNLQYEGNSVIEVRLRCGNGFTVVFAAEYHEDVIGPATGAECTRAARTRIAEVVGLAVMAIGSVVAAFTIGKRPPVPIDSELPRLPEAEERSVTGRRAWRTRADRRS